MRILRLALGISLLPLAAQQPSPIAPKDIFLQLTRTIAWYQRLTALDSTDTTAEDMVLRNNAHQAAKHVMQTTFKFARAEAAIIDTATDSPAASSGSNLQQSLSRATARVARLEGQLAEIGERLDKASVHDRETLLAQRSAMTANLALAKEMQGTLRSMTSLGGPKNAPGVHGFQDQINLLAAVNPLTDEETDAKKAAPERTNIADFRPETAGILTLALKTFSISNSRQHLDGVRTQTEELQTSLGKLREPLRADARGIAGESDRISGLSETATSRQDWVDADKQIVDLSARFKKLSSVIAPLSETNESIQSVRGALDEWRSSLDREYTSALHFLIIRVSVLIGGVLLVLLASAVWQHAILRYVHEPRRRRQFMVVKRVVVGLALAVLLALSLFSSFSSVATLLGFVTAGLALALQNVILSAVAYFFLVGRYGLRVGDRVTIQGVTGQVIEVGLIRLFLMELSGTGADVHPTGRVAVFANSVIFQPAALMRQAPGLNYAWHAVSTTLEEPVDYAVTRQRLEQAVSSVYEGYKDAIERQHAAFEKTTDMQTDFPAPVSRTQFTEHGFEVVVRYPVLLEQAGNVDDRVVSSIVAEGDQEPKLKFAAGGSPKISSHDN